MIEAFEILGTALFLAVLALKIHERGYNMGRHSFYEAAFGKHPTTEPLPAEQPKPVLAKTTTKPAVSPARPGGGLLETIGQFEEPSLAPRGPGDDEFVPPVE